MNLTDLSLCVKLISAISNVWLTDPNIITAICIFHELISGRVLITKISAPASHMNRLVDFTAFKGFEDVAIFLLHHDS